jgi:NitT/TauT family transport system substrate-binding protein
MKFPLTQQMAQLATILVLLSLAAAVRGQDQPDGRIAPLASNAPFTVAVNMTTIETAPIFVASAAGGGGIKIIEGGVRHVAGGGAHAGTNAETQMLLVRASNPDVRMLLTVAEGLYRIIARKSAGINTLADLRGKRIVTPRNTSAHFHLVKMLRTVGLTEADVTLVETGRTEMAAAIVRREADAISMWEPEAQNALEALGTDATVIQNNSVYRELFSLYTTAQVLSDPRRRRELVEFVRSVIVASDSVRDRPHNVIPLVAKMIKQTENTVSRSWRFHRFPATLPRDMLDVLTEEETWIAASQRREPLSRDRLAALIDTSVLKEAQQLTGR